MNTVRSLSEVADVLPIARDFAELLTRPDNVDIAAEFPGSVARYTGNLDDVMRNLLDTQDACEPGVRQQFVAFAGERAVGMSAIRFADEVQDGIEPSWPNLSGFVCNPYRSLGIGRLSLLERLKVVNEQFGGHAWTKVKKANTHSHRMVTRAGFVIIGADADSNIYAYHSEEA